MSRMAAIEHGRGENMKVPIIDNNRLQTTTQTTTLLHSSLMILVKHFRLHLDAIETMPPRLKDKLRSLLSKRGLVTDANLSKLIHKETRTLEFDECDISDAGLFKLGECSQLRKLDLNSAKENRLSVTSAALTFVSQHCPYLRVVYLRRCDSITDHGIMSLAQNCPLLVHLNIGGCTQLTDLALSSIGTHSGQLRSINFSKTKVTDYGVIKLLSGSCAKSLSEIQMNGCKKLTDEAIEAVINYCPQVRIFIFHGCPHITGPGQQERKYRFTIKYPFTEIIENNSSSSASTRDKAARPGTDASRQALEISGNGRLMKQVAWTVY